MKRITLTTLTLLCTFLIFASFLNPKSKSKAALSKESKAKKPGCFCTLVLQNQTGCNITYVRVWRSDGGFDTQSYNIGINDYTSPTFVGCYTGVNLNVTFTTSCTGTKAYMVYNPNGSPASTCHSYTGSVTQTVSVPLTPGGAGTFTLILNNGPVCL